MLPLGVHVSGPLLAWMVDHEPGVVERLRAEVAQGNVEILTSGRYEPILAALGSHDRRQQLRWMSELLDEHLGVRSRTIWLTERVWEDAIVPDLVQAGVENVLVDDWHFRVAGFPPSALDRPFRTEVGGAALNLLPISEALRYLIPFGEADSLARHLEHLSASGVPFVLFGDDGGEVRRLARYVRMGVGVGLDRPLRRHDPSSARGGVDRTGHA